MSLPPPRPAPSRSRACLSGGAALLGLLSSTHCTDEARPAAAGVTEALCQGDGGSCSLSPAWSAWLRAAPSRVESRAQSLRYLVRCALGEGDTVTLPGGETLPGAFGLARGWALRPLDRDGQELVSACLIALTNARGVHVRVGLTGPDLRGEPLAPRFSFMEASFYGNVFVDPPIIRACTGTRDAAGRQVIGRIDRVCGEPDNPCGVANDGPCEATGCSHWDARGTSRHCVEARGGGRSFLHPITVYLETREP